MYDVYGIGNALVDIEVSVNETFFGQNSIDKGIMTLIDENRQQKLLGLLEGKNWKKSSGGSAANTLMGISSLGGKAYYSCKVASDDFGDFFYKDLTLGGLKSNSDDSREEGITGKCLVMITPDADRTLNTFLGITQTFSKNELREEELKKAKYLYIEGYLLASPLGHEAAMKAKELANKNNTKVSLTLSDPFIVSVFRNNVNQLVGNGVDLIFCNEEEALSFAETDNFEVAKSYLKKVTKEFVITRGAKGSLVYHNGEEIHIDPVKTNAVNTNGAGDMYAGAFLYGVTSGLSHADSGKLASHCSAQVVSQFGPRLKTEELLKIKKDLNLK